MLETETERRPFKFIEIPLNKLRDEVIPYHQSQFAIHKNAIEKLINHGHYDELQKQLKQHQVILRQLKNAVYEFDALKTQVKDEDLCLFEAQATPLKRQICELIQTYIDLETYASNALKCYSDDPEDVSEKISSHNCQLMLEGDFIDLQVYDKEQQLEKIEALNRDIESVHEIFENLHEIVQEQQEAVTVTESNVEIASVDTKRGLKHLVQAAKFKAATMPVAGACIGTIIGGPIGSIAGFKVGAVAAIGCGIIGYVGGKFVKKKQIKASSETNEVEMISQVSETSDRKTK